MKTEMKGFLNHLRRLKVTYLLFGTVKTFHGQFTCQCTVIPVCKTKGINITAATALLGWDFHLQVLFCHLPKACQAFLKRWCLHIRAGQHMVHFRKTSETLGLT